MQQHPMPSPPKLPRGYIPPPFPFPQAWPQLFQTRQTTWLTPSFSHVPQVHGVPPVQQRQWFAAPGTVDSTASASAHPHWTPPPPPAPILHDFRTNHASVSAMPLHHNEVHASTSDNSDSSDEADHADDGEYVYGYVLSDEWRTRFHSTIATRQRHKRRQQHQQQRKQTTKASGTAKTRKQRKQLAALASQQHVSDLERELAAAQQRELTTRHPLPAAADNAATAQDVARLETQLALHFDEFCDAFAPVVWPHD